MIHKNVCTNLHVNPSKRCWDTIFQPGRLHSEILCSKLNSCWKSIHFSKTRETLPNVNHSPPSARGSRPNMKLNVFPPFVTHLVTMYSSLFHQWCTCVCSGQHDVLTSLGYKCSAVQSGMVWTFSSPNTNIHVWHYIYLATGRWY